MERPWVRLVLAMSLDGRIAMPNGDKTALGTANDRRVLEEAIAWSDGALIGGATLRTHQSTCLIHDPKLIEKRISNGLSAQPISLVVSSQRKFSKKWPFFTQPIERWILRPCDFPLESITPPGYQRQLLLKRTWYETLADLYDQGLSRLVILGGAQIAGSLLQADEIDELQLTITPKIIGGSFAWISERIKGLPSELANNDSWNLHTNKRIGNNELLLRYFRNREPVHK